MVVIALPKPPVVQHEQFHPAFLCLACNLYKPVLCEVKIGRLPVVIQNRSCLIPPVSSGKTLLIQTVERLAHTVQPLFRENHHSLRRLETLSLFQLPVKSHRMNPHQDSRRVMGIHLRLGKEISAVYQTKANGLSLKFICRRTFQHDKWIMLMGGISPAAVHRLDSLL